MRTSNQRFRGVLTSFAWVLAGAMACSDRAGSRASEPELFGAAESELRAKHGPGERRFGSDRARQHRRHRRMWRAERLEELRSEVETGSTPAEDVAAYDAGDVVGQEPGSDGADAGLEEPVESGGSVDAGGEETQPPLGVPRDIVARSALPIYGLEGGVRLSEDEVWRRIAASPATCFGEDHSLPEHHFAQTRGQAELAARAKGSLAFGFEMFERRFQATIDAFVDGLASEEQLLSETEYALRWGYEYSFYRPLVERARDYGAAILGLNARREIVRKISRGGLVSLEAAERAELPDELVLDDPEHRAFIFALFGILPEHAAQFGLENVYVAQTTWDETMADTSASWLLGAPEDARVMVFTGYVHCHRSAIPRRITRRTGLPALSVLTVLESALDASFAAGYDLQVVLDDVP